MNKAILIWRKLCTAKKCFMCKKKFPEGWDYVIGDAFAIAQKMMIDNERKFDIVICDPWLSMCNLVLCDEFEVFYGLAKKWFICGISIKEGLKHYKNLIDKHIILHPRSTTSGVCWLIFDKEG